MTDKYEEFKKWLTNYMDNSLFVSHCYKKDDVEYLFGRFEKEQAEKEKERQVKEILSRVVFGWSIKDLAKFEKEKINRIYSDLKEKDLIK